MVIRSPYAFETITLAVGVVILIALIAALVWWHIRFKHPDKDRFLKFWQHPWTRILTSILSLCLNIYSILEDPTIQSWRNMDLGILSLAIRFIFADWPDNQLLRAFKFGLVACSIIASLAISVHLIHHRWLRGKFNLEMFEKSRGQFLVAAVCFLPLVAVWALAYNGFISFLRRKSDHPLTFPYVESVIPISYRTFGLITSTTTGFGCFFSLVMIIDTMLQDQSRYAHWGKNIRPFWSVYRQPISWTFQAIFSGLWIGFVWSDRLNVFQRSSSFKFMRTTETTRCFILGLCGTLDICQLTQDFDFPSFDNPLELKLVFLDVSRLTLCPKRRRSKTVKAISTQLQHQNKLTPILHDPASCSIPGRTNPSSVSVIVTSPSQQLVSHQQEDLPAGSSEAFAKSPGDHDALIPSSQRTSLAVNDSDPANWQKASEELMAFVGFEDVVVSGKWFNYGAMIINLYVNISNMIQTVFYAAVDYAQYIQPDSRALWSINDVTLANAPRSELKMKATWEGRADFRAPDIPHHDIELHARFTGGSALTAAVVSGLPVLLGLAVFFEALRKYNRHPDDVARRARLRAQGAVKKLKGALRFISLAREKGLRIPDNEDVDIEETKALLSDSVSDDDAHGIASVISRSHSLEVYLDIGTENVERGAREERSRSHDDRSSHNGQGIP